MQTVSNGDSLHEMSNLFYGKNKKTYFKMSSAENFTQSANKMLHLQRCLDNQCRITNSSIYAHFPEIKLRKNALFHLKQIPMFEKIHRNPGKYFIFIYAILQCTN